MITPTLNNNEAIKLLMSCKPLAQKLVTSGIDYELSLDDLNALSGFTRVREANLLETPDYYEAAGLTCKEVLLLTETELRQLLRMMEKYYNKTIHDISVQVRKTALNSLGERRWVKLLLWFDEHVKGDLNTVKAIVRMGNEPSLFQLAICWLDNKGYGRQTIGELFEMKNKG
jgi:hypothetical protein